MKRIIVFVLICIFTVSAFSGCGTAYTDKNEKDPIVISVENTVSEKIKSVGISWGVNGDVIGSTGMQTANGTALEGGKIEFLIYPEDVKNKTDLKNFAVTFYVTDMDGASFDICTLTFAAEMGETYNYVLQEAEGTFIVWPVSGK